jgi:ubiquinone biosynthesis protein COQ4
MAVVRDTLRVGQAIVRVLADSTRTDEIHRVEEITGRRRFRAVARELAATPEGRWLLANQPELSTRYVDYDRLRALPDTTLGGAYVRHLDANAITADYQAAATQLVDDQEIAYLMRRFRQTHDVWHVLLGLGIQGHEEVLVHCFSWGQLRLPVSALVIAFGAVKHMVLERRFETARHSTLEAYRMGKRAAPLLGVRWEELWERPLERVRADVGVSQLDPLYLGIGRYL